MKFFGREQEIAELRKLREYSCENAQFTVLTGRRRVGKTALLRQAFDDSESPYLNLPVTRQPEITLCDQMQREAESVLGIGIHGTCRRFGELFEELMRESFRRPFTLVLDEFQEFDRTNPGIFGDVQHIWDKYQSRSKINLVVCGSVNRLMKKIFFNDSEPLYGRNTAKLELQPFSVPLLKEIFGHYHPNYTPDDLLALWTVSGGVARYVDLMMSRRAFTRSDMLDLIFLPTSAYIDEGRTVLADEFGSDYGTYFTIMAAIATGKTTSSELKNLLGVEVGGYLSKLEKDYALISKKQPLFERTVAKNCHYQIDDCFFRFWFRFVFKSEYLLELGRRDRMREIAERDFEVFSGVALERYFQWKFIGEGCYTRLGGWWDRKGENEIDLVGEDEANGTLDFYEVKHGADRLDLGALKMKSAAFFTKNPELKSRVTSFRGLSLLDM